MRRALVATTVALAVAGAGVAGSAVGQDTAGTVGPAATGQLELTIQLKNSRSRGGFNPAKGNNAGKRPRVADMLAGNGDVLIDGKKAGRVHGFDVATFQGARRYRGGAEFISNVMIDLGNNDLLFGICRASEDERPNPCAITGGTGKYAGARGTAVETFQPRTRTTQTINVVITFIP
jgi:hypothetical protein